MHIRVSSPATLGRMMAARVVLVTFVALSTGALAQTGARENFIAVQNQVQSLQPGLVKSVVNIRSGGGSGSGVIISKDGLILTAGHVIANRRSSRVTVTLADGRAFQADNLGFDRESDLGLLKISGAENLPVSPLGDSATLRRGQWILAIGHPLGQKTGRPPVLRIGRVLSLMRSREKTEPERVGTDAPLISGDSGGPLYDLNGRVVGINSMITAGGRRMASIHVPVNLSKAAIQAAARSEKPAAWDGPPVEFIDSLRLAESALGADDVKAAVKAAREAVDTDPDSALARLTLARALLKSKQPGPAAAALAEALDRGYNDASSITSDRVLSSLLRAAPVSKAIARLEAFNGISGERKGDRIALTAAEKAAVNLSRGIVRLRSGDRDLALGVVMSGAGEILTKASELVEGSLEAVLPDGESVAADIVATDPKWDVALVKVRAAGLEPLAAAENVGVGQWTFTPNSTGGVAALGIIGVSAMPVLPSTITIKPTSKAYLGIRLEPISREDLNAVGLSHGVRVVVEPDLPAARAGIQDGDIIFEMEGKPVTDPDNFMDLMVNKKPGDAVDLRVARDDERLRLTVHPTARPANLPGRGMMPEMLSGEVSRIQGPFPQVLHHDAVLRPNQMGGPLLDAYGGLLGMNIARADRTSTYAITARDLREIYSRLRAGK